MIGMAVHRAVIDAGDVETGVTIHEVTPELDAGPMLAQLRVPVRPAECAGVLAVRLLGLEHELLVSTLARLSDEAEPEEASASMAAALRPALAHGRRTKGADTHA